MKTCTFIFFILFPVFSFAQSVGDTIIVPTINYSQTFSPNGRDTMIQFPDDPGQSYEKIIMAYNMRCKDGLVSIPGNTNRGCGEWDYKCNTYITDSSRVDSILSYQASHSISHFSGDTFYFVETPTYDYYQFLQQDVELNNIISETTSTVGSGTLSLENVMPTDQYSGKSQFLITQTELNTAGMSPGNIDGITIDALSEADAAFLSIKMKHTSETILDKGNPNPNGFTEVFFDDYEFTIGENRIQFYTPFSWNGASNIIVEFSFTNQQTSDQLFIEGEDTGEDLGLFTTNGTHIINDVGYTTVPTAPLASITDEITVSLWCYGSLDFLPAPTSIISGVDDEMNRQLNIHLPWSNSSVYFDCGYDGGYDRIYKGATQSEIKGQWNHWAFTKNATSGDMKIYLNGELWHSGTGKTNPINIEDLLVGNIHGGPRYYFGKIDELRIWDKELNETTITDWMNTSVDDSHPHYDNLVAYYKFNEGEGNTTSDDSQFGQTAEIHDYVIWEKARGNDLSRGFETTSLRPNITFLQGEYDLTITEDLINIPEENIANVVTTYEVIPRYGTMLHDSIHEVSTEYLWQSGYEYTYNPDGELIDSTEVIHTGYAAISELPYYRRYPAKYEIMSFVTPYGIYLDLGMEGKTWLFDVTDYAPILKGWKRLSVELGGQRQEDMDIKFWYIIGTPSRNVLDINQIWRASSKNYTVLMDDRAFEPREFTMNPEGESYKLRSVITGHGQQGEFIKRWHTFNIDGDDPEFEWQEWTECSTVPIYPQGGTWIFDRAGWCPGDPSDIAEYDISSYVVPGQTHILDYDLTYATGQSNYQVSHQLVTYGSLNFDIDASIIGVINPNSDVAAHERFNPACSYPVAVVKNTGSTPITSLDFEYYVEGGEMLSHTWVGFLDVLETEEIELPIPDYEFWNGTTNKLTVEISNPGGQADEYEYNNSYTTAYTDVDVYDDSETLTIECKTNNQGYQTSYSLTDLEGNIIFEMDNLQSNSVYTNDVNLEAGCYQLQINDVGDNGLYFWYYPNYGSGYLRIKDSEGNILKDFEPEFGRFAIHEFGIADITGTDTPIEQNTIVSVFPNPSSNYININLKGLKNSRFNLKILNPAMERVIESEFYISDSDYTERLSLEKLSQGMYFLQLKYKGKTMLKKIVKN